MSLSYYPVDVADNVRLSESTENETQIFHPRMGPFVRGGAIYGVFQHPSADRLEVWKSTDQGATWTGITGPAMPSSSYGLPGGPANFATMHAYDVRRSGLNRDGDKLLIGYIDSTGKLAFVTFDMSTDTFGTPSVYSSGPDWSTNLEPAFMIASRDPTDEVYFVYNTPGFPTNVAAAKVNVTSGAWSAGPSLGFSTGNTLEALAEDWDPGDPTNSFWIRVWVDDYNNTTLRGSLMLASIRADDTVVAPANIADWYGGSTLHTGTAFDPIGFLGKTRAGGSKQYSNYGPAAAYGDGSVVVAVIETNQGTPFNPSTGQFLSTGQDLWSAIRVFTAAPADSPSFTEQHVYESQGTGTTLTFVGLPQKSEGYACERDGDAKLRIVYELDAQQDAIWTVEASGGGTSFGSPTLVFSVPNTDYANDYGVHWNIGLGPAHDGSGWSIFFGYGNIDNQQSPGYGNSPDTAWYPPGRPYYMESIGSERAKMRAHFYMLTNTSQGTGANIFY